MTGIRAWLAGGASAAALAFAGAGCGGSSPPPPADPATVAPADSILYADAVLRVPAADWMLQPILAVIPLQLLAYRIARLRGLNVDQPRNLAKTVTVE
ncbi:MAG TPA: hypothetical protein VNB50_01150 [Gaiellaceae bacterium]|nr:hypothetical protein [Gaiellaceae bacterium]